MTLTTNDRSSNPYALGHRNDELQRLIDQGGFLGELSASFLELAGVRPGMRVLDVGCGAGDLSFLAASLVGADGSVTGIDRSTEAIEVGRQRAASAALTNVSFMAGDVLQHLPEAPYDAVIGRLVLMYLPDPAAGLRQVASLARVGGLVTFHEFDLESPKTEPFCPLFGQVMDWMRAAFTRVGADVRMGPRLGRVFEAAGLPLPQMRLAARVERGPDAAVYQQIAGITRTLLPVMERTGVATAAEVDIETLADRLRQQAHEQDATIIAPSLIAAWARRA